MAAPRRRTRNRTSVAEPHPPGQNGSGRPRVPADTLTCVPDVFTAADARHWALLTRAALAARRTEIDDLNVFPVPDGDTGTNLYLTFDAAIDDVVAAHEEAGRLGGATLVEECRSLRRAILLSARGNSGVITSQIVGGLCDVVVERDAVRRATEQDGHHAVAAADAAHAAPVAVDDERLVGPRMRAGCGSRVMPVVRQLATDVSLMRHGDLR